MLAGTWYPAHAESLRNRVRGYLQAAEAHRRPEGRPTVVLAPHAGYQYSGPTAGKVLGLLQGERLQAVFVLAPSHRAHPILAAKTIDIDALFLTPGAAALYRPPSPTASAVYLCSVPLQFL